MTSYWQEIWSARFARSPRFATNLLKTVILLSTATNVFGEDEIEQREAVVLAPVVHSITVDGDLSEWPAAMSRHAIFNLLPEGQKSWKGTDFSTSPDLSAAFMVGYDPKVQLLYLGIIVRDDVLIVGNEIMDTDGIEVFVDGLCSSRKIRGPIGDWWNMIDLSEVPVQQYVGIPGKGKVYGTNYGTNPVLFAGDLKKTKTQMSFLRKGDVTTYEWAIQVFDQYPDKPTELKPGKRIGFDVVVVDKDVPYRVNEPEEEMRAWLYWGPTYTGFRPYDAGSLGEIILGE